MKPPSEKYNLMEEKKKLKSDGFLHVDGSWVAHGTI